MLVKVYKERTDLEDTMQDLSTWKNIQYNQKSGEEDVCVHVDTRLRPIVSPQD